MPLSLKILWPLVFKTDQRIKCLVRCIFICCPDTLSQPTNRVAARRGGAEVTDWTLDRKIRVRFPAYPHRVWALWWQGGKRRLRMSRCPCRGRLGTLKTPSCPWRGCPAAGQNLETGHLSRHYIAEISLNVTLNHNQQQQQQGCSKDYQPFT